MVNSTYPIEITIKSRIYGKGRGWVFTPKDFSDLGTSGAARKSLAALEKQEFIQRIAHGLYVYPRKHKTLGLLPPDITEVIEALGRKFSIKLQASGAYAVNQLGLTEQVPGRYVFLTDGPNKILKLANATIELKRTTPKRMKVAGRISGLVFEALRALGKDHVNQSVIARLKKRLTTEDLKRLKLDSIYAPAWITQIIWTKL